jgi:1-phosphofructokinase
LIATVTLNPALDRTLVVPRFAPGRTNRVQDEWLDAGGKGINVARMARRLGCPVIATGFLAGARGRSIWQALSNDGILTDFVELPGETRVNLKIVDPGSGTETEINEPGVPVQAAQLQAIMDRVDTLARRCPVVVLSGSLPPGAPADTYARLIATARRHGSRTILDAAGEALARGVVAGPDLVKPNRAEAEELLAARLETDEDLLRAAQALIGRGAHAVALSLGAAGALLVTGEHGVWRARPPALRAASSVGAGDAMVAAFACAFLNAYPWPEALRLATAASSVSALPDPAALDELRGRVVVEEVGLPDHDARPATQ